MAASRCFLLLSPVRAKTLQSGQGSSKTNSIAWSWMSAGDDVMLSLHKTRSMFTCSKELCMPLLQLTTTSNAFEAWNDTWSSSVAVCGVWRAPPVCRAKGFQMRPLLVPMRDASRQCVTVRRAVTCKSPLLRRNSGSALRQVRQAHQLRRSAQTRAANEVVAKCGRSVVCERYWRSCKQHDKA